MGAMLPKPVESCSVERHEHKAYRVGVGELNGWRNNMEDAHYIHLRDTWAFFGVFDGHGGEVCSTFVAAEFEKRLEASGMPRDNAAFKKLCLDIDEAFLDTGQESGATATMCVVQRPAASGGKFKLRVANIGDSRVLLGRADGTIVDGGGTDQGLTTDHKPNNPTERQRIYRCGGHVEIATGGVPRVNGELALSRAFGDANHKKTGGPGPEDRPVTANPEFGTFECDEADFLALVCDGVSEGDFSNAQVVQFIAERLREGVDPGDVARAVCHKAVEANSKDNITCMLVLFTGSESPTGRSHVFHPGPTGALSDKGFCTAYEGAAKKAGLTLAQAVEMRYEQLSEELATHKVPAARLAETRDEMAKMGNPPGSRGSKDRAAYFRSHVQRLQEKSGADDETGGGGNADILMRMLMSRAAGASPEQVMRSVLAGGGGAGPGLGGGGAGAAGGGRRVRVPDIVALKGAVDKHPVLSWDARMRDLAGAEGVVKTDDLSDSTSNVLFPAPLGILAWLPTDALMDLDGPADVGAGARRQAGARPHRIGQVRGAGPATSDGGSGALNLPMSASVGREGTPSLLAGAAAGFRTRPPAPTANGAAGSARALPTGQRQESPSDGRGGAGGGLRTGSLPRVAQAQPASSGAAMTSSNGRGGAASLGLLGGTPGGRNCGGAAALAASRGLAATSAVDDSVVLRNRRDPFQLSENRMRGGAMGRGARSVPAGGTRISSAP
eukprot:TRINITY_DN5996_c1_g2_i1.p1 TRINITY_DN5996_c1_g2~~TRINITY_DN5996_c1_g2_i1.p1  ORF type:complete len:726 (-),score=131.64 TRINITY_DN5996_c1_g2_i1:93-2270(-)